MGARPPNVVFYIATLASSLLPGGWIVAMLYWGTIAAQTYLQAKLYAEGEDEDDVGWAELGEYVLLMTAIALTSNVYPAHALLLIIVLRRFLWQDMPLPKRFRVSSNEYLQGGKRFILTGCASGVGRHLTGVLVRQGHFVCATDLRYEALKVALEEDGWNVSRVILLKLDVALDDEWSKAIETCTGRWGGLDVCMNIAGYLRPVLTSEASAQDIALHVDVNVKGVMLGTRHASRLMTKQVQAGQLSKGGHIINFSSLGGIAPASGVGLYIGTKYGCRGYSLCASKDLFSKGVFVTCVMPDAIQTPMVDLQLDYQESAMAYSGGILTLEQIERVILERVLIGREREVIVPTSFVRGKAARLVDVFSGALLLNITEHIMRKNGMQAQERRKAEKNPPRTPGRRSAHASNRSPSPAPQTRHGGAST